ncbi:unnamed protein product [Sphagnum compactum]
MALEVLALRIDPVSEVLLAVKQVPTSSIVRCASAKLPALSSSSSSLPLAISPSSASSYPSSCAGLSKLWSLPSGSGARRAWRVTASTTFFDGETEQVQNQPQTQDTIIPVLTLSQITSRLQEEAKATKYECFRSMYSSVVGAITTDVAAMVLPLDDHMVHRGHSVFDTAAIVNGYLYELDGHLDRLLRSAAKAKITPPFDRATMREILLQTVAAGDCRDGALRYWLSCGRGGFNLSARECDEATFYAIVLDGNHMNDDVSAGVKVITSSVPIKPQDFATVKSTNYLPNALVLQEAEERGAFAGIWLDDKGFIAEGQNMNVAFVKDGNLLVPTFDKILSGCTALRMLELVPQLIAAGALPGLNDVKTKVISLEEAKGATEMMLIGSGVIITPVVMWDDEPIGNGKPGPITLALRKWLRHDMMEGPAAIRTKIQPKISS